MSDILVTSSSPTPTPGSSTEVSAEGNDREGNEGIEDELLQSKEDRDVFNIDMTAIPTVSQDEEELKSLNIAAYHMDVLEENIINQVDKAIEKEIETTSLLRIELEKRRKIKRKRETEDGELEEDDEEEKKVESIRTEETDLEKRIRLGEMTPFGNALSADRSTINNVERYMENQIYLQKSMKPKERKEQPPKKSISELKPSPRKNKALLKRKTFFPKKSRRKERLGTTAFTIEESDDAGNRKRSRNKPRKLLSETTAFEASSGSEYLPESDSDYDDEEEADRVPPVPQPVKTPRRRKQRVDNDDEWHTDDSDWEDSADERPRKRSTKEIDDGVMDDYLRRVELWEKENNRDEITTNARELDNGFKVPSFIWEKLYKYQRVGVQWLWELHQQRCGGILGDEMGLGKTVQIISFLSGLAISKLVSRHGGFRGLGPVLIVCPTTLMFQWVSELHKWWPPFRAALLHVSGSHTGSKKSLIEDIVKNNGILITSYVGCVQQMDMLNRVTWHYVILDEGHKIRNPEAQVTVAVKRLATPHRLILSGSPMQNNLKELWSLFDFIFPGKLGTLQVFMAEFAVPITQGGYTNATQIQVATAYKCATVLRDTISPYLLRRMKADVKSHINLPGKNEQVLFCRLTDDQRKHYQDYLESGEVYRILQGRYQIFVGLINLRKICNHPDLYSGGPKIFKWDEVNSLAPDRKFGYWERAGKMIVVKTLLELWKKQEHRVLLFTQSKQMLHILVAFVEDLGYQYLKLDGSTSVTSRQPLINKFNSDKNYFVFLATTHVGGLGVNLTGANRVVIYDPDWNPATDMQARERAWRIGQQSQVTIYRLVTSGTIEEKIYHRQIFKQFLTNKVLKDPRQRRFFKSNDLYELFTLKEVDNNVTETSALFAGTGSEVKMKDLSHRDKVTKIKQKMSTSVVKPVLSQEKIEAMKKMAQALSQKIASGEVGLAKTDTVPQLKKKNKKKKEKHKKRKSAKFEGEDVPNLVKHENYNPSTTDGTDHAKQDDYILKKLFSKTGVQTALRHDKIMEEGPSDFAIIEAEADKVAKEAVRALKESRRSYQQRSEVNMASTSSPTKPRFGAKRISKKPATATSSNNVEENGSMNTDELFSRIRERNRLLEAVDPTSPAVPPPEEHSDLLADIRNFIAIGTNQTNHASTQELLEKFRDKLPAGKSPLFKSLLYEICEFFRSSSGQGTWRLRPEFRW